VGLNWGALVDTSGAGDVYALVGDVLYPSIPLVNIIYYGVAVIIIAAVASLVPALQAVRSEPAESLHHV
jgi:ABC-type lipoprotein release transport system permease subunit